MMQILRLVKKRDRHFKDEHRSAVFQQLSLMDLPPVLDSNPAPIISHLREALPALSVLPPRYDYVLHSLLEEYQVSRTTRE